MNVPTLVYQVTVGDLIQATALLVAAVGLFLNLVQLKQANRQKRAEYIISLHNQFDQDSDVWDTYYKIEYGRFVYDPEKFHESDEEKKLDKLLDVYDNIAKLYLLNNFKIEDLSYVAYNYIIVYQDQGVRDYLEFLDEWYAERGVRVRPYYAFRDVGRILESKYFSGKMPPARNESGESGGS